MKELKSAILMCLLFTVLCGGFYPVVVTAIAQAIFPHQANGSLITDANGQAAGSELIGQPFSGSHYFWPRPSATAEFAYNPMASGGSNSGPSNPAFLATVAERVEALRATGVTGPIPADLVLASASGLDPHLSLDAARLQIPRIAKARNLSEEAVAGLVASHTEGRQMGLLGEPRVNVLLLNRALDSQS
ncbi:MAG: potassium-transporting ATPase subunit KdpC [Deltaproteobacteria bacterium]|nr:potassium-transporting ATPase subunit KdpC [Deltaproteobacteria bacterium]